MYLSCIVEKKNSLEFLKEILALETNKQTNKQKNKQTNKKDKKTLIRQHEIMDDIICSVSAHA